MQLNEQISIGGETMKLLRFTTLASGIKLGRLQVVSFFLTAVLLFSGQPSHAQIPAALAGLTLNAALNALADRVDSSVQNAGATADKVLIHAGSEANAAISNMRAAYADMLDKTVESLDQLARDQLGRISATADALERRTAEDMKFLAQMVTQGALIVPFSNKQPQVTHWSPEFEVAPAALAPQFGPVFTLRFDGVFAQAAEPGLAAILEVAGTKIPSSVNTTQSLSFNVPRSILAIKPDTPASYAKATLVVPYTKKKGPLGLFGTKRLEARFNLGIVGLPGSPGKIVVRTTTNVTITERVPASTPQDNIQSDRDDHVEVRCGPNEGRPIDPNSVQFKVDRSEGDTWTHHSERRNNPSPCEWIRTEHHRFGTSDKVWFHFEYVVLVDRTETRTNDVAVSLTWGDSRLIPLSGIKSYVVTFDAFDGSHHEYGSQTQDDRFIVVTPEGTGLRITARPVTGILSVAR
jgi:hypothetical protein